MATEAQIKAKKKYHAKMRGVSIRLSPEADAMILEKLDSVPNKTDYIRQLVMRDLGLEQK